MNELYFVTFEKTCIFALGFKSGKIIKFISSGFKEGERLVGVPHYGGGIAYFWIHDNEEGDEKNAIKIFDVEDGKPKMEIVKLFSGYRLPVMLVRKK